MAAAKKSEATEPTLGRVESDENGVSKTRVENIGVATASHTLTVDTSGTSGVPLDEQKSRDLEQAREAQESLQGGGKRG